jgi:hypothetical protein
MTGVEEPLPEMPEPHDVVSALARVQLEIGGIRKMTARERQQRGLSAPEETGVKWAYRGIDQIASAAQPLFGRYGIVISPELQHHVVDDIVVNGKPWTDTTVIVKWRIYGPGGTSIKARTIGIGRDNSDKGYNKAMTGAYKNLLLRLLTVGDPQDDTDQHAHPTDEDRLLSVEQAQEVVDFVLSLPEEHRAAAKQHIMDTWGSTKQIPERDWEGSVTEFFDKYRALAAQDAAEGPTVPLDATDGDEPEPVTVETPPAIGEASTKAEIVEALDRIGVYAETQWTKTTLLKLYRDHTEPEPADGTENVDDGTGY